MKTLSNIFAILFFSAALFVSVNAQTGSFTKLGGEKFDFASEKGKVVVVAIGARWLPLSKNQASTLNKLSAKYDPAKVSLYFVMIDTLTDTSEDFSTDAQLEEFSKANKLTATVIRDPKGAASSKIFKPDQLPAFVVLGKDGKMVGEAITGIDPKADNAALVAAVIDKAVAGSR